jgi:Cu+-exporting ATPase
MNNTLNDTSICFHCGERKEADTMLLYDEKSFCCQGCSMVYQLLQQHHLCAYYDYHATPGVNMNGISSTAAFAALDEPDLESPFIRFSNQQQTDISFFIPGIHCSSCIWLLEHLHTLNHHIFSSTVDFSTKHIYIQFNHHNISSRQIAELLASIGYTPDLHTDHTALQLAITKGERKQLLELGIAGFCFANIMMLSFPEYLGLESVVQGGLSPLLFRAINISLVLPAFFYSGSSFFYNAWQGLQCKSLNIDMPIALAMVVTFLRSLYEISRGIGGGYLDSLSGIIFFMLAGRYLQRKISPSLHFNRRVNHYFPVAVAKLTSSGQEKYTKVESLVVGDIIRIHSGEIIPVDADLIRGRGVIDYAFVTGESLLTEITPGSLLYAGGKQCKADIDIRVLKPFSLATFSRLWNTNKQRVGLEDNNRFITFISNYFSVLVLLLAAGTLGIRYYFDLFDPWGACTSVLIVACPCGLLLTSSFTYGFLSRLFASKGFYLRNGSVLQQMAETTNIVFDKTGTLTDIHAATIQYEGTPLSPINVMVIAAMLRSSLHPLSKRIVQDLPDSSLFLEYVKEHVGSGIEAWYEDVHYKIGSQKFVGQQADQIDHTAVWISLDSLVFGKYVLRQPLRRGMLPLLASLHYPITILSGDDAMAENLFRDQVQIKMDCRFQQKPIDKYQYIHAMQMEGKKTMMIGDGLNDAGALAESNTGIAVVENTLQFSPASDAILHVSALPYLIQYLIAAKKAHYLIVLVFIISILYNILGLYFAVTAQLVPVIAAMLMPLSTVTIVLFTLIGSTFIYNRLLKQIPAL